MRPAAITLNCSTKDIQNNVCQIIYMYEKLQLNRLVWGSSCSPQLNNPSSKARSGQLVWRTNSWKHTQLELMITMHAKTIAHNVWFINSLYTENLCRLHTVCGLCIHPIRCSFTGSCTSESTYTVKKELSTTDSLLFQIQMSEHNSLPRGGELHDNLFLILSQLSSTLSYHLGN